MLKSFKGDELNPWIKIIIGVILVVGSAWYIINGFGILSPGWPALLTVIKGAVPLIVLIIGIFLIWLEWDELRIERELEKETEKPRVRSRRKK